MKSIAVLVTAFSLISTISYADVTTIQGPGPVMPQQSEASTNLNKGEKFLEENSKKATVKTLPSGLQYRVIKEGKGDTPKLTDEVTVNYAGHLINGPEFDSSYKRGEPATFPVNAVIPGWTEALQLMRPGAVWEVFIPSKLAYGEQGAAPAIGPNEALVFQIELLGVKKPQ